MRLKEKGRFCYFSQGYFPNQLMRLLHLCLLWGEGHFSKLVHVTKIKRNATRQHPLVAKIGTSGPQNISIPSFIKIGPVVAEIETPPLPLPLDPPLFTSKTEAHPGGVTYISSPSHNMYLVKISSTLTVPFPRYRWKPVNYPLPHWKYIVNCVNLRFIYKLCTYFLQATMAQRYVEMEEGRRKPTRTHHSEQIKQECVNTYRAGGMTFK